MADKDKDDKNTISEDNPPNSSKAGFDVHTPLTASGAYIQAVKKGQSQAINPVVKKYVNHRNRLEAVEGKLLAFQHLEYLAEYEKYCRNRGLKADLELPKLSEKLEKHKTALLGKIARLKDKIDREDISIAQWLDASSPNPPTPISLVPTRIVESNREVAERNAFIFANRQQATRVICQRLDLQFARSGRAATGLPENWTNEYGVKTFVQAYDNKNCKPLVQKMISTAKRR